MKVLYIGFKSKNNASYQLVKSINSNEKLLLTNSFERLNKDLDNTFLEEYDFIIMFGVNKNIKDKIVLEINSKINDVNLNTNINYKELLLW